MYIAVASMHPTYTKTIFSHQNIDQEPIGLFTPSTDGHYTIPTLESLKNYETEAQRSIAYPSHGKSAHYYYVPINSRGSISNDKHAKDMSIIYTDHQMQYVKSIAHYSPFDYISTPNNNHKSIIVHSLATDVSHVTFDESYVAYSW